ncbi:MAG: putative Ig domain-containing protein [Reichenbachiella sp.]|uniref:putative Ig domain-containing protein n=1 Tax=Reichenbachiella sp. TaxID=2184521 RepID=UPI0032968F37
MKHQNYLYLEYRRALRKFRKLQTRFEKRIANNTFQELTARRRYQLLSRLRKLKEKIEQLTSRLKLAAAGGSLAFTVAFAIDSQEVQAQQAAPKELSIDRTLANDATTGYQQNADIALNNEGNFAIVWEDENDGSLQGKGYGGDVDQSLGFSIPGGTSTFNANPSIAINDEDQFVVAWADSNFAIKYMRYEVEDGDITADGPYTAKDYVSGEWIDNPEVAVDDEGNFVIAWEQYNGTDYDVKARYYTHENVSAGVLDVSQNTSYDQKEPSVDIDNEGNFIVVWNDRDTQGGGSLYGFVTGRKYKAAVADGDEMKLVEEFDFGADKLHSPDVDLNGDGSFVVAWEYESIPSSFEYVRAQVFNAGGEEMSSVINVTTLAYANDFQIAADKDGGFIIVYEDSDEADYNIVGKRFNRFGDAIQESDFHFYSEMYDGGNPAVAMNDHGDFAVAWNDEYAVYAGGCGAGDDCDNSGVYFKIYSDAENEPYCAVDESQVNDYSTGHQYQPAVDIDINGNYVVVWEGESITDGSGIIGQRFNADGTEEGSEFQINTTTDNTQSSPDVAIDGSGRFIVTWSGYAGTSRTGVFAQMYHADGLPNGSEFRVDQETTSYYQLSEPSVDINHDGDAVIVWEGDYGGQINARVVAGPNSFDGNEFRIDASTLVSNHTRDYPDVAIQDDGSFVVTWNNVIGGEDQTFIRRFGTDASALDANDVRISNNYNTQTRRQSIAMDKNSGDFMVAFTENAGSYSSILASKYKSDGTAIFEEEELTNRADASDKPDIAANLDGDFAVVWNQTYGDGYVALSLFDKENELVYKGYEAINPDDSQDGVAVALDLDGDAIVAAGIYYGSAYNVHTKTIAQPLAGNIDYGNEFIVNSVTTVNQDDPDIAKNADGDFVIVWTDHYNGSGSAYSIKAQRYNRAGIRQGTEMTINDGGLPVDDPEVALKDDGSFMVVWTTDGGDIGGEYDDILGKVYDWDGSVIKNDFMINDGTRSNQRKPDVAINPDGNFQVVWSSHYTDYGPTNWNRIYGQEISPTGVPDAAGNQLLVEIVPESQTTIQSSIAFNEDGDMAIPFTYSYGGIKLFLSVFDQSFQPIVEHLETSNSGDIRLHKPAVTANDDGEFVVAWAHGSDYVHAYLRNYSGGESFDGSAVQLDVGNRPDEVSIEAVDDGDFIITFRDEIDDSGDYDGVWAQRLSYEMEKVGPEFLVNDTTQNDHQNSAMASSPDGSYTVVWEAKYTDGSDYAVMAKQFVSHKPSFENEGLTIDEGTEADITSDELLISNPSGGDESPLLTVTLLPSQGTLKLDGNAITLNQQLNEDDMFFLSYEHNGEEGTFDLFTFTVANEDFETGTNSFYISVNPVNDVPTVANPIPDQSTTGFESFSYTVPANTFTDVESEELTLSATLSNGSNLPSWLSFNAATRTFSGTVENDPDFDRTITIKVSASDGEASASDEFNIAIASVLSVDESNPNGVQLYPNPTEGQLHLRPPAHMVGTIDLYMFNASGQLLDQSRIEQTRASMMIDIDVAHLKKGLYLLKLVNENATTTYKINKD